MKSIIKTHFEKTTHRGGPIRIIMEEDMPKKSGRALCGVLLDDTNQPRISKGNVNCKECLNEL
ncbi:MAG TPA: hypothetical protein DEP25_02615 [Candidatus Taylorbacteria bacterium]|nr:MAG: hypothetical protein A3G61_03055 [Candidatus Taylorbacteria bacterium RIFCSPLOWO2_12_FULL_49_67]HCB35512.1 hypothetical protein [Candidatus Taylorbacteria bacterium]